MKQFTILLVDDEPWFIDALAQRLSIRGYEVSVAYDGTSALNTLSEGDFDAVLLDLQLPDLHGIQVLKKIRDVHGGLRVVIVTAHGGEKEKKECLALGAAGFLNKPARIDLIEKLLCSDCGDGHEI